MPLWHGQATRRVAFSGQTRDQRRTQEATQAVVDALAESERQGDYPCSTNTLTAAMPGDSARKSKLVQAAEEADLISCEREGQASLCSLTDQGQAAVQRRVQKIRAPAQLRLVKRKKK